MTLPNWAIRCIVLLGAVPLMVLVAVEGALKYACEEGWHQVRDAWREPEYTRWGSKRHDR